MFNARIAYIALFNLFTACLQFASQKISHMPSGTKYIHQNHSCSYAAKSACMT